MHESIVGTLFTGRIVGRARRSASKPAIVPEIQGSAWITGEHTFLIDGDDPLKAGLHALVRPQVAYLAGIGELAGVDLRGKLLQHLCVGDVVAFDGHEESLGDDEIEFAVLALAVPPLEAGVAVHVDRFFVAVAGLLFVAGGEEHRPRCDQQLTERRVDDLHFHVAPRPWCRSASACENGTGMVMRSPVGCSRCQPDTSGSAVCSYWKLTGSTACRRRCCRHGGRRALHGLGEVLPSLTRPRPQSDSAAFFSASAASLVSSAAFSAAFSSSDLPHATVNVTASPTIAKPLQETHSTHPPNAGDHNSPAFSRNPHKCTRRNQSKCTKAHEVHRHTKRRST